MLIFVVRLLFITAVCRAAEVKTTLPYRSENGECNNKTIEYYNKEVQMCCSKCQPGTHLSEKCTTGKDTVCKPCEQGLYSDTLNYHPNCHKCPSCRDDKGLRYERVCTNDTKTLCDCKPEMFCSISENKECKQCKKYKTCKPGEGATDRRSPSSDVKCKACPSGTFSDRSDSEPCKPHTTCENGFVLRPGNATADTLCENKMSTRRPKIETLPNPTEPFSFATIKHQLSSTASSTPSVSTTRTNDPVPITPIVCSVGLLVVLIMTLTVIVCKLRNSKGISGLEKVPIPDGNKVEKDPSANGSMDCQRLLSVDGGPKEPSTSSSDTQSQPDSSPSHSSGEWLERSSQEEYIPEQPSVSSPVVNLSITATFNCHLNTSTPSCSIPINTGSLTPHVEAAVPLSQEEVCISCQQEDGKEALRSVQESGPCIY